MKRKFLEGLGIDSEIIDKVMAEYGTSVSSLQTTIATLTTERDDFKGKLETKETEYTTIEKSLSSKTKEYDTLKSESDKNTASLTAYQNKDVLTGLGVDGKYLDFVSHEISTKRGDKGFKEFAEGYLKENAHYKSGSRQTLSTQPNLNGGDKPSGEGNQVINAAIRNAAGRQ